jgi:hypothetical protein
MMNSSQGHCSCQKAKHPFLAGLVVSSGCQSPTLKLLAFSAFWTRDNTVALPQWYGMPEVDVYSGG